MTIPIKNKDGIAKMREACAIAATVLEKLKPLVKPGVTTQDLEEAGRDWIARLGARSACYGYTHGSRRYPAHTCISVNEEVVHGIPSFKRVLHDGDIVSLDVVVWYDGYVGDNAFTLPVGTITPANEKLLRVTQEALDSVSSRPSLATASVMFRMRFNSMLSLTVSASSAIWLATGSGSRCTNPRRFPTSAAGAAETKSKLA